MPKETERAKHPWTVVDKIRQRKNVSKKALAKSLGINYSYLVDLLNGRYPSKIDNRKLTILAEVFQVPIEEIIGELSGKPTVPLPVVGKPQPLPQEDKIGVITIRSGEVVKELLENPNLKSQETFRIKLDDDSMFPPCSRGSIFVVTPLKSPQVNNLTLVIIRDGRTWLGELDQSDKEWIILKLYNPDYESLQIERKDISLMYPVSRVELAI